MYIPGRLRTGSKPSRTVICPAPYASDVAVEGADFVDARATVEDNREDRGEVDQDSDTAALDIG